MIVPVLALATVIAVRAGIGTLPTGTTWRPVVGLAIVAGVGFTVALFVTSLSFEDPAATDAAKLGILLGSAVAAGAGFLIL